MSLKFHWFMPTYGDSRYIVGGGHGLPAGVAGGSRPATLDYLGQIARSAEQLGFVAALTPTARSWAGWRLEIVSAALPWQVAAAPAGAPDVRASPAARAATLSRAMRRSLNVEAIPVMCDV